MKRLMLGAFLLFGLMTQGFSWFDGFYLGASGGLAFQQVGLKTQTEQTQPSTFPPIPISHLGVSSDERLVNTKGWGEIYGGWGEQVGRWCYLGARLGWNLSNYEFVDKAIFNSFFPQIFNVQVTNRTRVKLRTSEFTGDFKPGFTFNDSTMLFGIVGVAVNHQTLDSQGNFNNFISGNTAAVFGSNKLHRAALRLGLGLEKRIWQALALNVSYVYTRYQKISASQTKLLVPGTPTTPPIFLTTSARANPRKSVASVGLAYYF